MVQIEALASCTHSGELFNDVLCQKDSPSSRQRPCRHLAALFQWLYLCLQPPRVAGQQLAEHLRAAGAAAAPHCWTPEVPGASLPLPLAAETLKVMSPWASSSASAQARKAAAVACITLQPQC